MLMDALMCAGKYAIGYAVAPALEGPYTKTLAGPWLGTTNGIDGLVRQELGVFLGPDILHTCKAYLHGQERRTRRRLCCRCLT